MATALAWLRSALHWLDDHTWFLAIISVVAVQATVWIGFDIAFEQHDELTRTLRDTCKLYHD